VGADVAPFHTLLRLLLSPSNEQRGQAEAAFFRPRGAAP